MLVEGMSRGDVLFAVGMLTLFVVLFVGIVVVLGRLSRNEKRIRKGQCPKCGGVAIEHRPLVREGERVEDSRHVAWYCKTCDEVVHFGPKQS